MARSDRRVSSVSPRYDFTCEACDFGDEIDLPMDHSFRLECPRCQFPLRKVIAPAPIHFKGKGFYSTDKD